MSKTQEHTYKDFVKNHCVRDHTLVQNCLLSKLKTEIITLSVKISRLKRLIISDGRFTDFNTEIFTKLIQNLEPEAEELLLSSEIGRSYLGDYGPVFIKQLVFCGCCIKLGLEVVNNDLLKDDAKLIYSLILNYYLAGNLININKLQELKKRIREEELQIGCSNVGDFAIFDDFFLAEFPEVDSNDKKQLESIKNYLADERVKELIEKTNEKTDDEIVLDKLPINLEKIEGVLQLLDILPELTTEQKQALITELEKNNSSCNNCMLTPSECLTNRQKTQEIISQDNYEIKNFWNHEVDLRSCLILALIEKLKH